MKLLATFAILLALTLAGCTGGGAKTPEQDAEGNYLIHATSGNKFTPATAKVPVGANVTWVNDGGVHDVTANDGTWSSDDPASEGGRGDKLDAGDRFTRKFDTPGTYRYHCDLHASVGMKGTLVVE